MVGGSQGLVAEECSCLASDFDCVAECAQYDYGDASTWFDDGGDASLVVMREFLISIKVEWEAAVSATQQ